MDFTNPVNNLIRAFIPIPRQYLPKETNRHRAAAQYGRGLQARLQAASVLAFRPVLLAAALRAAEQRQEIAPTPRGRCATEVILKPATGKCSCSACLS